VICAGDLRGLPVDDVERLLVSMSQQRIARPLAELLHRRTGGNPLLVHELLRFVVAEGLVESRDGALRRVGDDSLARHIPEGMREVIGTPLSRLSVSAKQALSVASVIGREFPLQVLGGLLGKSDEELEAGIEEAVAAAIIEEHDVEGAAVTYRFLHVLSPDAGEEMLAPRRIRLHQAIARVLEDLYARMPDEHASELAEHYSFSSDAADLAKAVHYGRLAAKRDIAVFAYTEAVRQLKRALHLQERSGAAFRQLVTAAI
jgi:predicted ATPase